METLIDNAAIAIQEDINWFESIIDTSLTLYFKNESEISTIYDILPPDLKGIKTPYTEFIYSNNLNFEERLVLILSLIPHIKPQTLDVFLIKNQNLNTDFSEFGGYKDANKSGFFPTLETACFILGGHELSDRLNFLKHFHKDHFLFKKGILDYDTEQDFGLQQRLKLSNEYLGWFATGKKHLPQYNSKFPAKELSTNLDWKDLIVEQNVMDHLTEIRDWLIYSETILNEWGLKKNLKAGYRVLFYGSPGTGKTLAATLLGKATNRPVFSVDLSLVVSKYIGETEKNLGQLFDEAEHKDWILFFDEADALFGKRTQTKGANDRYANQEVAYLLQRIENFSGLVILATNIQTNIDEAFSRRFQNMVYFPKPGKKERKLLWESLFIDTFELGEDVNLDTVANDYELSGGEMINVLRYCALEAAKRKNKTIHLGDILNGIRREYNKSNKTI